VNDAVFIVQALFHAAFTWVTFRAFGVHFVYTSTLASGATAILPLLASWSVSVPAALGLLAKGQGLKVRYFEFGFIFVWAIRLRLCVLCDSYYRALCWWWRTG